MIRETNERIFPGSFYLNLIIRLSVFSLTALVVIIAVINISKEYLIISLNLVLLLVFQVISLYRFISKIDKDLVRAFTAIRYNEFSDSIRDQKGNRGFERFRELINEMNSIIKDKSKEIRSKEILLRDTIEFSPGALIIFDKDGRVVNINKAATRLTGINKLTNIRSLNSLADSLGNRIMDMQPGSPLRLLIDTNTASLKSTGLTLLFNKESFNSDDAELNIVSIQDIRAVEINQEIDSWQKIIRVIRHEIMNSLSPIPAITSSLRQQIKDGISPETKNSVLTSEMLDNVRSGLATIEESSKSIISFISKYRQLTSLPQPVKAQSDIVLLLHNVINKYSETHNAEVRIKTDIPEAGMRISIDPDLIMMALSNIIKNGLEACEKDPVIDIELSKEDQSLSIDITDNGKGIPNEAIENIFVPFYTTKDSGSGIGLSIARQIIVRHGGSLELVSTGTEGACFRIELPG